MRNASPIDRAAIEVLLPQMVRYLTLSSVAPQSMARIWPDLTRWATRLAAENVTQVLPPGWPLTSAVDVRTDDVMCLMMAQVRTDRDAALEHWLRNKIGVRPYKD